MEEYVWYEATRLFGMNRWPDGTNRGSGGQGSVVGEKKLSN
jgi:hypothetical protein